MNEESHSNSRQVGRVCGENKDGKASDYYLAITCLNHVDI